jgi:hypothetical protein
MIDIVKNVYPNSKIISAEMIGDILKVEMNPGDIRFYKFKGDKLYVYKPIQVLGDEDVNKIKSIIREGKINQVIKNG